MKKILIVGNQGYIGTALSEYLITRNYDIQGLDLGIFKNNILEPINECRTILKDASNVESNDLKKYDCIINLAGMANDPISKVDSSSYYDKTVEFSNRLASYAKQLNKFYIYPSSCSVYGNNKDICSEVTSLNPLTEYAKSKVNIENYLLKISDESFKPIILRLGTVFGFSSRMRFDLVINMFIGMKLCDLPISLNSNGISTRPHLYIKNVCEVFEQMILNASRIKIKQVFNVGTNGNNMSIIEVAKLLSKMGNNSNIEITRPGKENLNFDQNIISGQDKRDYTVNFDKINEFCPELNFTSIPDGIEMTIQKLLEIGLDKSKFENKKFYRLKYLETL